MDKESRYVPSRGWMGLAMTTVAMRKRTMDLNCIVNDGSRSSEGGSYFFEYLKIGVV